MDKVTAAMVLTSLSTSPLVRSPPVKVNGQYHDYLTDAICLKLNSLKKKNSSVKNKFVCSALLFIPSQLLSCECMRKLRLINYRHLLCFRILSSATSAYPQRSTMSLDLCHSSRWRESKVPPRNCNHVRAL